MNRPIEHVDLELVHNEIARLSSQIIRSGEEHAPMLMITMLGEKPGTVRRSSVVAIPAFHVNQETKALLMPLIDKLVGPLIIVAHISEAWTIAAMPIEEAAKVNPGDISKNPNRIECLLIALHTMHHTYSSFHPITGTIGGVRDVQINPFDSKRESTGRLTRNPRITA